MEVQAFSLCLFLIRSYSSPSVQVGNQAEGPWSLGVRHLYSVFHISIFSRIVQFAEAF